VALVQVLSSLALELGHDWPFLREMVLELERLRDLLMELCCS
jgi:hypothetical protein